MLTLADPTEIPSRHPFVTVYHLLSVIYHEDAAQHDSLRTAFRSRNTMGPFLNLQFIPHIIVAQPLRPRTLHPKVELGLCYCRDHSPAGSCSSRWPTDHDFAAPELLPVAFISLAAMVETGLLMGAGEVLKCYYISG